MHEARERALGRRGRTRSGSAPRQGHLLVRSGASRGPCGGPKDHQEGEARRADRRGSSRSVSDASGGAASGVSARSTRCPTARTLAPSTVFVILVDTNVLVALVDERERLHAIAKRDLRRFEKRELGVTTAVLTECVFLLSAKYLRQRLAFLLEQLGVVTVELEPPWWQEVFAWLERYAEHDPDFADAHLAVISGRRKVDKVWTYDGQFRDIWRRPDGSKIPLLGTTK